jgi:hypothetical protein
MPDHRAHARGGEGLGGGLGVEVHVVAGGDAAAQHLGGGQQGAVAHEGGETWRPRPARSPPAASASAAGRRRCRASGHCGVGVQVDQAGDQHVPRQLDGFAACSAACLAWTGRTATMRPCADRDRVVIEDHVGGLDGDDPAWALISEVDGFAQEQALRGGLLQRCALIQACTAGGQSVFRGDLPRRLRSAGGAAPGARAEDFVQQSRSSTIRPASPWSRASIQTHEPNSRTHRQVQDHQGDWPRRHGRGLSCRDPGLPEPVALKHVRFDDKARTRRSGTGA